MAYEVDKNPIVYPLEAQNTGYNGGTRLWKPVLSPKLPGTLKSAGNIECPSVSSSEAL